MLKILTYILLLLVYTNAYAQNIGRWGERGIYLTSTSIESRDSIAKVISKSKYHMPVEGAAYIPFLDTTSSINELINRLNTNWELIPTFKGYWIGFTDDMFSITAKGDSAIDPLVHFIDTSKNQHAIEGAIYTLYLIGIDGKIEGRGHEEFVNIKARKALLDLLKHNDLQSMIAWLLERDKWETDVPMLFSMIQNSSYKCAEIIKLIINHDIPELPNTTSKKQLIKWWEQKPPEYKTQFVNNYGPLTPIRRKYKMDRK